MTKMNNKEAGEQQEAPKKSMGREVLEMVVYILIVAALTWLLVTFVGQRTVVSGRSMNPTLENGDNLITDKISYRFSDPKRYDIVVFPFEDENGKRNFIKRIIGLPGETVQIKDGEVYINGELLGETYGKEKMDYAGRASEPITLGDDEYFVLGDNRNNSEDSRHASVGNVKRSYIEGKVWLIVSPKDHFGLVK